MSALLPGARVRLPEALGGGEARVVGRDADFADVDVPGVGTVTVPAEKLTEVPPLPWSYAGLDGARLDVLPGPTPRSLRLGAVTRVSSTEVVVPLAPLFDALRRAVEATP